MKNEIRQITGLRGVIAFLIAYVLHWTLLFGAVPEFHNMHLEYLFGASCPLIFLSPNLFFLLSGYLIHKSYYNRITDKTISLKEFFLPKMRKMYPMVILTASITFIVQNIGFQLYGEYILHADGGEVRNSFVALLLSFLGMQSGYFSDNDTLSVNGPAWFVAILFLCYGMYFLFTSFPRKVWMQRLLYLITTVVGVVLIIDAPGVFLLYSVNGRGYCSFFLGVLICEFVSFIEGMDISDNMRLLLKNIIYIVSLICLGGSFYLCCVKSKGIPYEPLALAVLFWPALMYIVIHGYVLRRLLSLKVFVLLGKISMPIFLCNLPTDLLIRMVDKVFELNLNYKDPWLWFVHIIISLIIATVFHFFSRTHID